jgi:hypothetical protein
VPTLGLASLGLTYGEMLAVESRATTHASMISNSVGRNLMPGINAKETFSPFNRKIVIYPMRQLVKKHVAIRAKAKDVFRDIRPIVGTPEWLEMADFCVRACHCYESCAADLAGKIVQSLYPFTHCCASHNPSDCELTSFRSFISVESVNPR